MSLFIECQDGNSSLRLKEITTSGDTNCSIPRNSMYFLALTGNVFIGSGTTGLGEAMDADAELRFSIRTATENKTDPKET
jgi:hypothetical protein